jgi:hypothetical protein
VPRGGARRHSSDGGTRDHAGHGFLRHCGWLVTDAARTIPERDTEIARKLGLSRGSVSRIEGAAAGIGFGALTPDSAQSLAGIEQQVDRLLPTGNRKAARPWTVYSPTMRVANELAHPFVDEARWGDGEVRAAGKIPLRAGMGIFGHCPELHEIAACVVDSSRWSSDANLRSESSAISGVGGRRLTVSRSSASQASNVPKGSYGSF